MRFSIELVGFILSDHVIVLYSENRINVIFRLSPQNFS